MGKGVSSYTHAPQQLDHYANQHNPNSTEYQEEMDNYANQLNPNNEEYQSQKEV